jgi:hypothetical protein
MKKSLFRTLGNLSCGISGSDLCSGDACFELGPSFGCCDVVCDFLQDVHANFIKPKLVPTNFFLNGQSSSHSTPWTKVPE